MYINNLDLVKKHDPVEVGVKESPHSRPVSGTTVEVEEHHRLQDRRGEKTNDGSSSQRVSKLGFPDRGDSRTARSMEWTPETWRRNPESGSIVLRGKIYIVNALKL